MKNEIPAEDQHQKTDNAQQIEALSPEKKARLSAHIKAEVAELEPRVAKAEFEALTKRVDDLEQNQKNMAQRIYQACANLLRNSIGALISNKINPLTEQVARQQRTLASHTFSINGLLEFASDCGVDIGRGTEPLPGNPPPPGNPRNRWLRGNWSP